MSNTHSLVPVERIEKAILLIRGQKVMLDADLANLYGVETKVLIQAVKRNLKRFPGDFMFQATKQEWEALKSQIVTSKGRGGRRIPPYFFTEQGVAMLSSVLSLFLHNVLAPTYATAPRTVLGSCRYPARCSARCQPSGIGFREPAPWCEDVHAQNSGGCPGLLVKKIPAPSQESNHLFAGEAEKFSHGPG